MIGIINTDGTVSVHEDGYDLSREDMTGRSVIEVPAGWSPDVSVTTCAWDTSTGTFSESLAVLLKKFFA